MTTTYDGTLLKNLIEAGKHWLQANYQRVDQLNVFPVPDGDTGKNMLMTLRNAYQEVENDPSDHAATIAKRLAHGAIMGSRGNSGTILSQILVGFADGLANAPQFDVVLAAKALENAKRKAYEGVQSPVEGTILTVIREMAEEAQTLADDHTTLQPFLAQLVKRGWESVARTPELLPVLKEANVVDSGGTGLVYIFEGMLKFLSGEDLSVHSIEHDFEQAIAQQHSEADLLSLADQQYNYDVQFVILGDGLDVLRIKQDIEQMGDSGVIVGSESLVKVHIHVDDPSIPIGYGVRLGKLDDVVIENMQLQYEALLSQQQRQQKAQAIQLKTVEKGQVAVIAVAAGRGQAQVLGDLGVAGIIDGGQTNNPSVEQILQAAKKTKADQVIVLPNNKNIILAAQQASTISQDITIKVVPTTTFPQGVAAMLGYDANGDLEAVAEAMDEMRGDVVTLEVTNAVRTVDIDGVSVQSGQVLGLLDGKMRAASDALFDVIHDLLATADAQDRELLTIYTGADIAAETTAALIQHITDWYDNLEIELLNGDQPHYHYIMGLE